MSKRLAFSLCAAAAIALLGVQDVRAVDAPADPSFSPTSDVPAISHDFGIFRQGDPGATFNFSVYNRAAPTGTTSPASLSTVTQFGDVSSMVLNTGTALHIPAGGQAAMQLLLNTTQPGNLEVLYTLSFTSDTVVAPLMDLSIAGTATILRRGDYDADGDVDAADYVLWRKTLNQIVAPGTGADGSKNGFVDQPDYDVWRSNFTGQVGAASFTGGALTTGNAVPEPATCGALLLGLAACHFMRRRCKTARCL